MKTNLCSVVDGILICSMLCQSKQGQGTESLEEKLGIKLKKEEDTEDYVWVDVAIDLSDIAAVRSTGEQGNTIKSNKAQLFRSCGDSFITNLDWETGLYIWIDFRNGGDLVEDSNHTIKPEDEERE